MQEVPQTYRLISDPEWAGVLKRSITERVIDGVEFPSFPPDAIQSQFVGSANESSLDEALKFYQLFKLCATELDTPINYDSRVLDFGCGWGRFLRFFWRDVRPDRLHGVDIDPDILNECRKMGIQADLQHIDPYGRLPFQDGTFSHIFAYSVFTHLPEAVHLHWLAEISRVARPGCVFICTTEPRRFLDFIQAIPEQPPSDWHAGLKRAVGDVARAKELFDQGNYVYIPTGGGQHRDSTVYGDAVIPEQYIRNRWTTFFKIRDYIDNPSDFWQSLVVASK